jgi:hypothetical protein
MEDLDIEFLRANGYDYKYGGIIDAEGKYISSLELKEHTLNSESTAEQVAENFAYDNKVKEEKALKKVENGYYLKPNTSKKDIVNSIEKEEVLILKSEKKYQKINTQENYFTELQVKEIYNYPVVLGLSLLIFYLIKKLKE